MKQKNISTKKPLGILSFHYRRGPDSRDSAKRKAFRPFRSLLELLLLLLLANCTSYTMVYDIKYDISLRMVERPADAKTRYGEQMTTLIQEGDTLKYSFEDEMVKILWLPTVSDINFILENKTNHSINIIWDEAAFVDEEGQSHRVMHSGVKYADKDKPQPPSVIVKQTTLTDLVFPADNVHFEEGWQKKSLFFPVDNIYVEGGWRKEPIFPTKIIGKDKNDGFQHIQTEVKKHIGKSYQVLLPLQIEDVINEYIFSFQVDDVKISRRKL